MDEFAEACDLLQKHLPERDSKEQLLDICRLMDINKDGLVDLNEFLETFRLCEQSKMNTITGVPKDTISNAKVTYADNPSYNQEADI